MSLNEIRSEVKNASNPQQAKILQGFFKTGPGQYGEGDVFAGLKVPVSRSIAKKYTGISFADISELIGSKIHEERLIALFILIAKYKKADLPLKEKIFRFYIKHIKHVNNWDLVDLSAPNIIGTHLLNKEKDILYTYAVSKSLWVRRIAVISTFAFIRNNELIHTFAISDILINDKHDLIHKAAGWMLREAGKRDYASLEEYLIPRYNNMPRTMLRYAIEKFPEERRKEFLHGRV
jgi:3-methyladenine DNA glycosylase AlkD